MPVAMLICGYTSLDLSAGIVVLIMAESSLNTKIKPYQFEPTDVSGYSDNEDDSSSESETDIREQASFTERLGTMDWCECAKCSPMPSGIECQCCREMEGIDERLTEHRGGLQCITDHEQFKVVCLNKDVLYTALVTVKSVCSDSLRLTMANRYRQLINADL